VKILQKGLAATFLTHTVDICKKQNVAKHDERNPSSIRRLVFVIKQNQTEWSVNSYLKPCLKASGTYLAGDFDLHAQNQHLNCNMLTAVKLFRITSLHSGDRNLTMVHF